METWKAKCPVCGSPAYYYPAKLLLERTKAARERDTEQRSSSRIVSCNCTGKEGGVKHTIDYSFPEDFQKI
ncbi:hypothetical protein [Taibaiella koreensis]|uniref:hypothetical protein n=1 Tax=Taibaiella koreensis TaxID=1268548 RepID=UPI000E59CA64|nr:hypothetical protein [Taibaiella koreensis]